MSKKKKYTIISIVILLSFAIMGIVYALLSDNMQIKNKITIGSVKIENLNLKLKNLKDEEVSSISPADIDILSWTTKNIGTSGVLTRHTLEVYWTDESNDNVGKMLYLYPANMTNEAILEDYKNGDTSQYMLKTKLSSKEIDGRTRYGFKYQFVGDTLDGTSMQNVSKEINYNSTESSVIDSNISTDDTDSTIDTIAYKLLLSPETSYIYQGMKVYVKLTTEAMQYTEDGSAEWKVVDTQELP